MEICVGEWRKKEPSRDQGKKWPSRVASLARAARALPKVASVIFFRRRDCLAPPWHRHWHLHHPMSSTVRQECRQPRTVRNVFLQICMHNDFSKLSKGRQFALSVASAYLPYCTKKNRAWLRQLWRSLYWHEPLDDPTDEERQWFDPMVDVAVGADAASTAAAAATTMEASEAASECPAKRCKSDPGKPDVAIVNVGHVE
jgi:hypothetical protein